MVSSKEYPLEKGEFTPVMYLGSQIFKKALLPVFLVLFSINAISTDWYVDDGSVGCLGQGYNFTELSSAVSDGSVTSGDSIYICNGTYVEDLTISKSLNIIGESEKAILSAWNTGVTVSADYVNMSNLKINSALSSTQRGVVVTGDYANLSLLIADIIRSDNSYSGLVLDGANDGAFYIKIRNISSTANWITYGIEIRSSSSNNAFISPEISGFSSTMNQVQGVSIDSTSSQNTFTGLKISNISSGSSVASGLSVSGDYNNFTGAIVRNVTSGYSSNAVYGLNVFSGAKGNRFEDLSLLDLSAPNGQLEGIYLHGDYSVFDGVTIENLRAQSSIYTFFMLSNSDYSNISNVLIRNITSAVSTVYGMYFWDSTGTDGPEHITVDNVTISSLSTKGGVYGLYSDTRTLNASNINISSLITYGGGYPAGLYISLYGANSSFTNLTVSSVAGNQTSYGLQIQGSYINVTNSEVEQIYSNVSNSYGLYVNNPSGTCTGNRFEDVSLSDIRSGDSSDNAYGLYMGEGSHEFENIQIEDVNASYSGYGAFFSSYNDIAQIQDIVIANVASQGYARGIEFRQSHSRVDNVSIEGVQGMTQVHGIYLPLSLSLNNSLSNLTISDLYSQSGLSEGMEISGTNINFTEVVIDNVSSGDSYAYGLLVQFSGTNNRYNYLNITDIRSGATSDYAYGAYLRGNSNIFENTLVEGVSSQGNPAYGFYLDADYTNFTNASVYDITSDSDALGFYVYSTVGNHLQDVTVENVSSTGGTPYGVEVMYSDYTELDSIEIRNLSGQGVAYGIYAEELSWYLDVDGVNVSSIQSSQGYGAYLSTTGAVYNNMGVKDVLGTSGSTPSYGIYLGTGDNSLTNVSIESVSAAFKGYGLLVESQDNQLEDIAIQKINGSDNTYGLYVDGTGNNFTDTSIESVNSSSGWVYGLFSDVDASNNRFVGLEVSEIWSGPSSPYTYGVEITGPNNTIRDTRVRDINTSASIAIGLSTQRDYVNLSNATISNINSITSSAYGLYVAGDYCNVYATVEDIILSGPHILQGFWANGNNNIYRLNVRNITKSSSGYHVYGVYTGSGSRDNVFLGLNISDISSQSPAYGMVIEGEYDNFTNAQVSSVSSATDSAYGIQINASAGSNRLVGTSVSGIQSGPASDSSYGIRILGAQNVLEGGAIGNINASYSTYGIGIQGNETNVSSTTVTNINSATWNSHGIYIDSSGCDISATVEDISFSGTQYIYGLQTAGAEGNTFRLTINNITKTSSGMPVIGANIDYDSQNNGFFGLNISGINSQQTAVYGLSLAGKYNNFTNTHLDDISSDTSEIYGIRVFNPLTTDNRFVGLTVNKVQGTIVRGLLIAGQDNHFENADIRNINGSSSTFGIRIENNTNVLDNISIFNVTSSQAYSYGLELRSDYNALNGLTIDGVSTSGSSQQAYGLLTQPSTENNVFNDIAVRNIQSISQSAYGLSASGTGNTFSGNITIEKINSTSSSAYGLNSGGDSNTFGTTHVSKVTGSSTVYGINFGTSTRVTFTGDLLVENVKTTGTSQTVYGLLSNAVETYGSSFKNIVIQYVSSNSGWVNGVYWHGKDTIFENITVENVRSGRNTYGVRIGGATPARNVSVDNIYVSDMKMFGPTGQYIYGFYPYGDRININNIHIQYLEANNTSCSVYGAYLRASNSSIGGLKIENINSTAYTTAVNVGLSSNLTLAGVFPKNISGTTAARSVYLDSGLSGLRIHDSELSNSFTGADYSLVSISVGEGVLTNVSYEDGSLSFGDAFNLTRAWWLTVNTNPDGVTVEVKNNTSAVVASGTSSGGYVKLPITQYIVNDTGTLYNYTSTHSVTGSKSGYNSASNSGIGLDGNNETTLTLTSTYKPPSGGSSSGGGSGGPSEAMVSYALNQSIRYTEAVDNVTAVLPEGLSDELLDALLGENFTWKYENCSAYRTLAGEAEYVSVAYDLAVKAANCFKELSESIPNVTRTGNSSETEPLGNASGLAGDFIEDIMGNFSADSRMTVQDFIEASAGASGSIRARRTVETYDVGGTTYTSVTLTVTNDAGEAIADIQILMDIPKEVAGSVEELEFTEEARLLIIQSDPIVAWVFDVLPAGESYELMYSVIGNVSMEDAEETATYVTSTGYESACPVGQHMEEGICVPDELACVPEGGTIPVIASPPECCPGLELIPPKEEMILGISGFCTAKCGNEVCDAETESDYNCPADCAEGGVPEQAGLDWTVILLIALILAGIIGAFMFKSGMISLGLGAGKKSKKGK